MGYLDNTQVIVDAVLTKRGRELLARNDGSFRVTQFALADDEIDYSLFNEFHPNGSQFAGEAIENGTLLDAWLAATISPTAAPAALSRFEIALFTYAFTTPH